MKKLADCGNSQTNTEPAQEETQSQSTESTGEETPSQSAESTDDDTQTQADTAQDHETEDSAKVKVAKDGADMQTEDLPYKEEDVHYGWLNGDIDYATDAPYFTILFADEEASEQFGYQVNIGVITTPLSEIAALEGSFDVRIELAE